jgi:AraC-like DNA-binding protein
MADVYKQSFKQSYTDNIELSIFNCGLEKCAAGHTWGPGIRDHYLIHLVLSGKGTFQTAGRTWDVQPGDLFLAVPNQLIAYTADAEQPWEYCWVGFNGACAHALVSQLPFTGDEPVHHTKDPDSLRRALSEIFRARGPEPQDEAAMVGYLYLFMAALMKETRDRKPRAASSANQYVLNAIKYIQFNYSHDISIDDVAASVGISRSHLYRVFMSNVGKSPIDYLTEYRVNEACKLLRSGSLSIAEVAVSVGFFDQFYFSRVFKKSQGMPPSKYVARHLAEAAAAPESPNGSRPL